MFAFTPDYVPMAPTTALCLASLGMAIYLRTRSAGRLASMGLATVAGLGGLLASVRPWLGWASPWEDWLAQNPDRIGDTPVGQMSPLTGALLLVLAGACWLQACAPRPRSVGRRLAAGLAGVVLLAGGAVVASYAAGKPWLYGSPVIPMALWTAMAFVLLGLGFLGGLKALDAPALSAPDGLTLTLAGLGTVVIAAVTASYLRQEQTKERAYAGEILHAIGDLKLAQLVQWRGERLTDANYLHRTPYAARRALDVLAPSPSERTRQMFTSWLDSLFLGGPVDEEFLLDGQLNVRLRHPQAATDSELDEAVRRAARQALQTREVVVTELYRPKETGPVCLSLMVPFVVRREGTNDNVPAAGTDASPTDRAVAVLGLQINAHRSLFPILRRWPTPSRSAETVLITRVGDEVVFLNELRHRTNSALRVRFPLTATNYLPAARAVLGQTGLMEGRDYRGVPVLADVRPVPGTQWLLLAKVDREEIFAPLRQRAWLTLALTIMLTLAVVLLAGFISKRRETALVQRELASERERSRLAQRVEYLMKHASDAILLADEHDRVVEANERMASRYGYPLTELPGMHLAQFRAPSAREGFAQDSARVFREGKAVFETLHQRRDGSTFPVEISSNVIELEGRRYKLGILRDITERKAHEREIERLTRLYATLSQVNQSIVRVDTRQQLFQNVCRIAVKFGGFKLAWIGWPDAVTQRVTPVAYAGDAEAFLEETRVRTDHGAEGRGPVGICLQESRSCVFNDFLADERAQPWREGAAKYGLRAVAAFPIRYNGEVCAAFAVCAGEPHVFQDQEVALLEETAYDISFALENLEREERRRAAEEAMRASAAALLEAQRLARLGNWESDSPKGPGVWSPELYRIYARDPALGPADSTAMAGNFTPEGWARLRAAEQAALNHGTPYECDLEVVLPDGNHRWITSRGEAMRDAAGNICGLRGTTQDITERKQAEEALRESQDRYRSLVEQSPDAIGIFQSHRLVFANAATVTLLRAGSAAELLNRTREQLIHPDDLASAMDRIQRRLGGQAGMYPAEVRYLRLDGTSVCVEVSITPVTFEGKPAVQFIARDITERHLAEARLRNSEALYHSLVENLPQHVFRKDLDGRFTFGNAPFCRSLGRPLVEILGKTDDDFCRPELAAKYRVDDRRVLEAGEPFEGEELHQKADGSTVFVNVVKTPLRDAAGKIIGLQGISWDITARKRTEQREQLRGRCLQLLGTGAPLPEVLESIVALLECGHDHWRCAIMLLDDSGRRLLHGAAPRLPEFYREAINGLEVGPAVGSCGAAAATGQLVVAEDIDTHPFWEAYRDLARRAGIRACWSQPIRSADEEILGTFAIYHAEPRVPT